MVAAGVVFGVAVDSTSDTSPTSATSIVTVPTFKGLTVTEAIRVARRRDGRVFVALRAPSNIASGTVISQTPSLEWPIGLVVSSGPWRNNETVLAGETTRPVEPECARPVTLTSDGNVFPLLCAHGRVNVGAWLFYSRLRPSMMSLARNASLSGIISALCDFHRDVPAGFNTSSETLPEQEDIFLLAEAYNGWRVPKDLDCAHYQRRT